MVDSIRHWQFQKAVEPSHWVELPGKQTNSQTNFTDKLDERSVEPPHDASLNEVNSLYFISLNM